MSPVLPPIGWTALVLAGGRGSRLGNDDKAAVTIGGRSSLDHLLSSIPVRVPVVVSGPECPTRRPVAFRRERPVHGGPVAGISSGLDAVGTPVTALLGVDMPWAGGLLERLVAEFDSCGAAALVPVDDAGFRQPLCSVVRTEALREALLRLGDPRGRSLRDLLSLIDVHERPLSQAELGWVDDINTAQDLDRARSLPSVRVRRSSPGGWASAVCAELNLTAEVDLDVILDVARSSARHLGPAAAPVSTFLLGAAVAGGMEVTEAAARIQDLTATWRPAAD